MIADLGATSDELLQASTAAGGFNEELQNQLGATLDSSNALNGLLKVAEASDGAFSEAANKAEIAAAVNEALGISATIASDGLEDEATSLEDIVSSASDAAYALGDANTAIYNLGTALQENGTSFSAYSQAGRDNLSALQGTISALTAASGGDAQRLAVMLQGLMTSLANYGVASVQELAFVQEAIARLTNGKGITNLAGAANEAAVSGRLLGAGFAAGAAGVKKSGGAAKGATKEIKTLTEYVSDLGGVFKAAFEIRFGLEQSIDAVAAGWQKMADAAQDARDEVADATQELIKSDATIAGLNAANSTLNYQLTVAQEYGDVLRANEIMAEIAENNAEISDEQKKRTKTEKDLAKAQAAGLPILDGQTEGAREQRDQVTGLVKAYQDQILALANSGLSQQEVARRTQELKNQFIAQLTAMGYSRAEIDRYAAAFDDLTTAIQKVPRNITVNADTNPAQRAIDEFIAKNSNKSIGVGATGGGGTYTPDRVDVGAGGLNVQDINGRRILSSEIYANKTYFTGGNISPIPVAEGGLIPQHLARGGVAGINWSPQGTDTIPAMLTPDEYVVNRQAVARMGLPFMNALNNQQLPKYLASGGSASSGGSSSGSVPRVQLVELMPYQVQQLAQAMTASLSLDGKIVAEATNSANATSARRGSN
jgi:hypothetical protein